jgi:NADPH2:quinone reductase
MKAVRIHKTGGPEVLQLDDIELPPPGPDHVRIRHRAIGVNFIDTYHRSGLYPLPLPAVIGSEAAGTIEAVGENVRTLKTGDRVAYCMVRGSYAEGANIPAWQAVKLPAAISDEVAAAALLKGLTARYLLKATYPVKAGQTSLLHAAARHRNRWFGRQDCACQGEWLRMGAEFAQGRLGEARARADQRRWCAGGL